MRDFLEHLFWIRLFVCYTKWCSEKLVKFTAKFMLTAVYGTSENKQAVNLLFCRIDCKSVFKVLSLSFDM